MEIADKLRFWSDQFKKAKRINNPDIAGELKSVVLISDTYLGQLCVALDTAAECLEKDNSLLLASQQDWEEMVLTPDDILRTGDIVTPNNGIGEWIVSKVMDGKIARELLEMEKVKVTRRVPKALIKQQLEIAVNTLKQIEKRGLSAPGTCIEAICIEAIMFQDFARQALNNIAKLDSLIQSNLPNK
ncbi:MAG: hypothetical protein JW908_00495 [Anaerolineales bacterium]|nr:hypothetical protein [Anaerolineales bacterium]